jgi:hypothetical protein
MSISSQFAGNKDLLPGTHQKKIGVPEIIELADYDKGS